MDTYIYNQFGALFDTLRDMAGDNADILLAIDNLAAQVEEAHEQYIYGSDED